MADAFGIGLPATASTPCSARRTCRRSAQAAAGRRPDQGEPPRRALRHVPHRLMFPIADTSDRIVGFGGRTLGDDPAKYLNTPLRASLTRAVTSSASTARERPSAKRAGPSWSKGTPIASWPTSSASPRPSPRWHRHDRIPPSMLRRYADRVVLLFDSDEAGQRAADRALIVTLTSVWMCRSRGFPRARTLRLPFIGSAKGFEGVLNAAIGALEFKWQQVVGSMVPARPGPAGGGGGGVLQQLSAWIGHGAIDPIKTGLLVNQLSQLLSLPGRSSIASFGPWSGEQRLAPPLPRRPGAAVPADGAAKPAPGRRRCGRSWRCS